MVNPFDTIDKRLEAIESLLFDSLKHQKQDTSKPPNPLEKLTRKEVCERYKISLGTVHALMRSGELPYAKIKRKTIFQAEEVEAFFQANKKGGNNE